MKTTKAAIASAYMISPLLCVPLFLAFSIQPKTATVDKYGHIVRPFEDTGDARNMTLYIVNMSDLGRANNNLLTHINFWVYSVVIKLIPCAALTELSRRLIRALLQAKTRRQVLSAGNFRAIERQRQTDRSTRMLLAVLLLFLLTEFPQGILGLLSVWFGDSFFKNCYQNLGEVMDILALINSSINFILYCTMSRQFRSTFNLLFLPSMFNRSEPQHNESGHNGGCTVNNNMTLVTHV
jgi:hypothetical protein